MFSVNVSAGHWYISFKYEAPTPQVEKTGEVVGVDLGIHHLATRSGGEVFPNPKPYRKAQRRLVRLQRRLSRKQKGSANRKKAVVQDVFGHQPGPPVGQPMAYIPHDLSPKDGG